MNKNVELWRYVVDKVDAEGKITPLLMVLTAEEAAVYAARSDLIVYPVYREVQK